MIKQNIIGVMVGLSLSLAIPAVTQGIVHTWFMRGSIIGADQAGQIVCIGKADAAEVGQILTVYRVYFQPGQNKGAARRDAVGHVRIDHLFDDHFAHVSIVDGSPAKNDIVELQRSH